MNQRDPAHFYTIGKTISNNLIALTTLFQDSQPPKYRQLATEEQRFKLWAHSVGLYQRGHASLDYQIRDADAVMSGFAFILESLHDHLDSLLAIERHERSPYEALGVNEDDDQETEDDKSDRSESDSGNGSHEAITSSTPRSDASFHEVDFRLDGLKETIDTLYSLTDQARSLLYRPQRDANQLYEKVPAKFRDTEIQEREAAEISNVCRLHRKYLAEITDEAATALGGDEMFAKYSSTEHWLLRRTGIANARRKQQFIYWKEHAERPSQMEAEIHDRNVVNSIPMRQIPMRETIENFLQRLEECTGSSDRADLTSTVMFDRFSQMMYDSTLFRRDAGDESPPSSTFGSASLVSTAPSDFPRQRLPCEFYIYDDCNETFDLRDIDGWVHHNETQHLRMILPSVCWCWFCDEMVFRASPDDEQQRRLCYTNRMNHIAGHFRRGSTMDDVRPDFEFLHHLWINDLISQITFDHAKTFHEAPQPKRGINSVPPPSVEQGVVVVTKSRPPRSSRDRRESHTIHYTEQTHLPIASISTRPAARLKPDNRRPTDEQKNEVLTTASPGGKQVHWPDPPEVDVIDGFFVCPYCEMLCPEEYLKKSAWIVHLTNDLRPYHCTYKDCPDPHRIYGSRQDWIDHEHQHTRVWHCYEHTEQFKTQQEYLQHLERSHPNGTPEQFSKTLVAAAAGPSMQIHRDCPFCPSAFTDIANMQSHLIFHLEWLAQLALYNGLEAFEAR
ncbi:hypothetical protein V8C35DRAFT_313519 [Trichoderma chlorosporum]